MEFTSPISKIRPSILSDFFVDFGFGFDFSGLSFLACFACFGEWFPLRLVCLEMVFALSPVVCESALSRWKLCGGGFGGTC